jgi:hypothetical protein
VRFAPGANVYLDGVRLSQTNWSENGSLLRDVKVGAHKVTIEVPNGGSATIDVNVAGGELSTVSVSPLALHAGRRRKAASKSGPRWMRNASPRSTTKSRRLPIPRPSTTSHRVRTTCA